MTSLVSQVRKLARLNQLYAMLSRINRTIVRADDPQALYEAACRIAVDDGSFRLAWVGLLEPAGQSVVAVARSGTSADSACLRDSAAAGSYAGVIGRAIRGNQPCIANDLGRDGPLASGPALAESVTLGAAAAFPLYLDNRLIGAFAVAAKARDFFDAAEIRLLEEVAGDISFALEVMRKEEQRVASESKALFLANYDSQTGLPARSLFEERLAERCERASGHEVAVMAISLRNYHGILQTLGQAAGIDIVRAVAGKLERLLPTATVARLSDSEFGLVPEDAAPTALETLAGRIHAELAGGISGACQEVFIDAFIGVARHPRDGSPAEVLRRALVATGKRHPDSGASLRYFSTELEQGSRQRLGLETALRRALDRQEFVLHYQPQLDLGSGQIVGAEALLRWKRPGHGLVGPAEFIPLMEENGLIGPVSEWVLDEACRTSREWQKDDLPPVRIAVNLSALQFLAGEVKTLVRRTLDATRLDPEWLELELTESAVLQNAETSIRALRELKAAGVSVALDDFGTGYSSLSYLQRLPVDRIKIDQSFVRNVTCQPGNAAITRAIVGMAHSLGLTTIAEGVETEGQLGFLRSLQCDEMQGFYFSRPVPAGEFAAFLGGEKGIAPSLPEEGNERVLLLVDDEPNILSALKRALRPTGLRILTTTSVREAFNLLAANPVGVVLCDQRMPEMAGAEFLRGVKEIHPETVRMMLTGHTDLQSAIDAINQGAVFRFLTKPWEDKPLLENILDAFHYHELERENRRLSRCLLNAFGHAAPPAMVVH